LASSKERKVLLDTKLNMSLNKQCNIYSDFPSYGYRRITKQLQRDGYNSNSKGDKKLPKVS